MNIISLIDFIERKDQEKFLSSIKNEVCQYISNLKKENTSANISVFSNSEIDFFSNYYLSQLLLMYIENKLLEWDIDYILNGIELSGIKCEDRGEYVINILSSYSIINKELIKSCLKYLIKEKDVIDYDFKKKVKNVYNSIFIIN